ncbi:anti sigma factor C-terminal domain-containing protein [Alkalihalophilus marmarensis]|uniref:anti sigma factor C-terminal domain-containing protein n=1 Tax=Alkalihalophilus marmarensis TaxID=521377 RepID=UPI002DB5905F|nr:anti sigma factor C-terminal domain-containing protein [Alkalihalophilus marmarensis]MEC2074459.1 anti sigma factor C-terminal domain-containing protein [Alkalihalophilus marmarensis]
MSNDKTDDIFDVKKMEKTIKKAKRRANWKTVLITVMVLFVIIIAGSIINRNITDKLEMPVQLSAKGFHEISAPNEFIGKLERYQGILGGENRYTTYKIIEGKVVYTGQERYGYGLFRDEYLNRIGIESPHLIGKSFSEEDLQKQHYNELGQREMVFFYPFIQYKTYRNDLALLDDIGEDKVMEVALSFDQGYTFKEVQSLIPDNMTLTWLWVDDVDEEKENFQFEQFDDNGEVIGYDKFLRSEHTVYGVPLLDENGDIKEEPVFWFIGAIEANQQHKARWQGEFKRLYETLSGADNQLTEKDLQYYGAVVTGNAQNLSQLKDLPFIKASSIGVITDKY